MGQSYGHTAVSCGRTSGRQTRNGYGMLHRRRKRRNPHSKQLTRSSLVEGGLFWWRNRDDNTPHSVDQRAMGQAGGSGPDDGECSHKGADGIRGPALVASAGAQDCGGGAGLVGATGHAPNKLGAKIGRAHVRTPVTV